MVKYNLGFVEIITEYPYNRLESIITDEESLEWIHLNKKIITLYETKDVDVDGTSIKYHLFIGGVIMQAWMELTLDELRLLFKELEGAWA